MEAILTLRDNNGKAVVSARELHEFLEVNEKFTDWCKRMFEYGFSEGLDFIRIYGKSQGGRPSVDYALSLDCAKEISMLQRTEKGKQARQYFIDCENRMREKELQGAVGSEDMIILKAITTLQARVEIQQEELQQANKTIQEQAPKVKYTDQVLKTEDVIPITIIAKELGFSAVTLNHKLAEIKVQFRQGDTWVLYAQYQNKGYTKTRTHTYYDKEGKMHTSIQTYWTEKGRAFLHGKINPVFNTMRPSGDNRKTT